MSGLNKKLLPLLSGFIVLTNLNGLMAMDKDDNQAKKYNKTLPKAISSPTQKEPESIINNIKSITSKQNGALSQLQSLNLDLKETAICFDVDQNLIDTVKILKNNKNPNDQAIRQFDGTIASYKAYMSEKDYQKLAEKHTGMINGRKMMDEEINDNIDNKKIQMNRQIKLMEDENQLKKLIAYLNMNAAWVGICSAGPYKEERGKVLNNLGFQLGSKDNEGIPEKYIGGKFSQLLSYLNNVYTGPKIKNVVLIDDKSDYPNKISYKLPKEINNEKLDEEKLKLVLLVNDNYKNNFVSVEKIVTEYKNLYKWLGKLNK